MFSCREPVNVLNMTANPELVRVRNDPEMEERRALKHEDSIAMSHLNSIGSGWSESEAAEPCLEGMDAAELQDYCQEVSHQNQVSFRNLSRR